MDIEFEKELTSSPTRVWSEEDIRTLRKHVNSGATSILNVINKGSYAITPSQSSKGIEWLNRRSFKKNGDVRKNCPLKAFERSIVQNFREFRFVGLYNVSETGSRNYMPIYRAISNDYTWFEYVAYNFGQIKVLSIGGKRDRIEKVTVWN